MDADDELCPSLPLSPDIGISTSNRSVGTLVQFVCSSAESELVGSSILYCSESKTWNGTAPECASLGGGSLPTSTANVTEYSDGTIGGLQVDTVVVVLWCCGGALLLTLIVLIACILQTHKKGISGVNRRTLCPGRQPRHGGVNPTFTSYDEIWTWIPVVTDSQNNCNSPINPSARQSSATNGTNVSTIQLPSYEHAVRNSPIVRNSSAVPRNSAQITQNSTQRDSENHYDTIPVDLAARSRASGGATSAPVSRPSNALSALTAALQSLSPERRGEPTTRVTSHPRRGNNPERRNENRPRGNQPQSSSNVSHVNEVRERSQQFYRQYGGRNQRQRVVTTNPGFRHSEGSMFSYFGENGRRVYCDVPPTSIDDQAPPPYNNNNYESQNSNRPVASAPIMRLEYDYF